MPSAPSATSASSARSVRRAGTAATKPAAGGVRPSAVATKFTLSRVRWDRTFRAVMLVVLGLVGWIGVQAMSSLLAARAQSDQQQAVVRTLARENRKLAAEQAALTRPATIMQDARTLGMVRAGERSYAVTGLPSN